MKKNAMVFILSILLVISGLFLSGCQAASHDSNQQQMEKELKAQNSEFDKCVYQFNSDNKDLSIEFHYENDTVFSNETQTAIRDSVTKDLSGKYNESSISITILSDQSPKIKQYKYENGKWDKEISQ